MTIICYRDGVMCADTAVTAQGMRIGSTKKIIRLPSGGLAAACGPAWQTDQFRLWAETGLPPDQIPPGLAAPTEQDEFSAMVVERSGRIRQFFAGNRWSTIDAPFQADGCAWRFAMGVMAAGCDAICAVELTIEYHDGCGGPVQIERLHP